MANQVEVPKSVAYTVTGSDGNEAAAAKVVAYMILVPGEGAADDSNRQAHVYSQIIRRR